MLVRHASKHLNYVLMQPEDILIYMLRWVIQSLVISGAVLSSVNGVKTYVNTLPPIPKQAQITCHDTQWEDENLVTLEGTQIHRQLAPFIKSMLFEARGAGSPLQINVAYRSCAYQLQLRGANCGLGDYNLYQKPSNLCSPPTEPAGSSLHNEGLAIDFACSGYALIENSPCLTWLQNNAVRYHLLNRASEAWHWSTTGV